ncbi:uncharacterized protein TNIN_225071 [Trichonephila inaurata madagascariensis]|uniref:Uncharacterized protein n=1 Tax=Trichonephila inaurata madagascariensis TaxID=2747483 RepID=A0A8X6WQZ2_9ARAC|nr:uncharacterized protein TNIN_225071 [Trichonephila inaurata madagascariensis]
MGCQPPSIHRRYPTTARCGSFCLLRFPAWAGSLLLRRPGVPEFPQAHHIDTVLSALPHYCTLGELFPVPFSGLGRFAPPLDDLVFPSSLKRTISTPCLAWTPDRHRAAEDRTPNLTPSNSPRPPEQLD